MGRQWTMLKSWATADTDEGPQCANKINEGIGYHKGYTMYDKESYLPDKLKNKKYLR